jgi:hopanoid C-2 methylase
MELSPMNKRVLVVNVFLDEYRRPHGSPFRVPRGTGHIYLAGTFNLRAVDVRVYSEQVNGPLRDARLLGWPDMLVLTGLTSGFDRMLHLAAYARTLNPRVLVVAGGPAVRALPKTSRRFFDRVCRGDVEELKEVAEETLGPGAAVEGEVFPRYDLAEPSRLIGYVESSRYCNFRCSFCSLSGEGRRYRTYDLDFVRRQIEAVGKRWIIFLDNNFYGSDRQSFLDRLALLTDLRQRGTIDGWAALVTGDFFTNTDNVERAKRAGCVSLFSGVESFNANTLRAYNKRQNTLTPQIEMIRSCLEAGILFQYGIMLDPSTRPVAELEAEIDFILSRPEITLPAYFTLSMPILGTPYFRECLERGKLLPNLRLGDVNPVTLTLKPLDPVERAVAFARDLVTLRGRRRKVAAHCIGFLRRYGRRLSLLQLTAAMANAALTCLPTVASSPFSLRLRSPPQTYYAPTEHLDPLYQPFMRVNAGFERYFRPTMLTAGCGGIAADVAEDIAPVAQAVQVASLVREEPLQPARSRRVMSLCRADQTTRRASGAEPEASATWAGAARAAPLRIFSPRGKVPPRPPART